MQPLKKLRLSSITLTIMPSKSSPKLYVQLSPLNSIKLTNHRSPKVSTSNRHGESRAAYNEVQNRHEDIKKIERTLEELAQLFNDVSFLLLSLPKVPV